MSGFSMVLITFLLSVFSISYGEVSEHSKPPEKIYSEKETKDLEEKYELALLMYKRGSYYTALNILSKIVKERDNPYYPQSLLLSAKIYLRLGIKTGIKEFLQKALYYLNTYSYSTQNPFNWEFYYIKGNIYENMFMYERALAAYKMAFGRAQSKKEQFKTIIGILRTAVWLKRLDIFTRYLILVNLEELSETEKREFEFVKGLAEFQKGNYAEAIKYLTPVYKNYEQYLIENPDYYLIIGENAYRLGDYSFAKKIFRRIISIVKDESVIRKATLRLGDIALKNGDKILSFNYYYRVLTKYPDTKEAKVAKLKLIALSSYKEIKRKLLHSEDKDFKDPLTFVVKTLVLNRNNYVGFFALGNFGSFAINSRSDEIFKKLVWELSLVDVSRMRFEHTEYINRLWGKELKKAQHIRVCQLYRANKKFFFTVFDRKNLLITYKSLKKCGKYEDVVELAEKIYERWKDEKSLLLLSDAYFSAGKYKKSLEILRKIKTRDCDYFVLLGKNSIFLNISRPELAEKIITICKKDSIEKYVIASYLMLENGKLDKALDLFSKVYKQFYRYYSEALIGKMFLRKLVYTLFKKNRYSEVLKIIQPVSEKLSKDCDLNSWYLIAMVRTGKAEKAEEIENRISRCETQWSIVAKNVYENFNIVRRINR
ncbi:hypothetical protein GWK41_05285 [Persephonella atlantica]|uniref:Tetratricopeptide repeat protein n=1 Tax=Persephonella atlantica TaxID=2699429 RepID=A0ABS1GHR0_9AQUI|nr:tetratricopeptide repeat protein [Persephonella atlantica]MBK3332474.1 hypothetical protein [Persephonella atlantica]